MQFLHLVVLSGDEPLMLVFGRSSQSKNMSTERLPEAIALASASKITSPGIHPNESEDLSILEKI